MYEVDVYVYPGDDRGIRNLYRGLGYSGKPKYVDFTSDKEGNEVELRTFLFNSEEDANAFQNLLEILDIEGLYY